ncbi:SRPBCC family protein [Microcella sp.]|uniref:SRPBCC family protein n=1 Tax=Microcella sp. TaxID=1913979 RepID=UPI002565056A|nr:SRPBCC domain-containing protein [Microcella sp.]MBX9470422.1 SRPBCC domain-containing protein [Microcella sp.]
MPVTDAITDLEALSLTFVTEHDAPVDRVWQLWADPRQLERWWGPPEWPATFTRHDFVPGGWSNYYMTGPNGEKAPGWWIAKSVEAPTRFEFRDGFEGPDGRPDPTMPTIEATVTLDDLGDGRTRMVITSVFPNADAFVQMREMGMEEGMQSALGQIEALLAG